jgi:hypothetical protein
LGWVAKKTTHPETQHPVRMICGQATKEWSYIFVHYLHSDRNIGSLLTVSIIAMYIKQSSTKKFTQKFGKMKNSTYCEFGIKQVY